MSAGTIHYFVLRSGRSRMLAFVALASLVLIAPIAIPADQRLLRMILAVNAVGVTMKMHDLGERKTQLPEQREFFRYLFNPTSFVLRKLGAEPSPPMSTNV